MKPGQSEIDPKGLIYEAYRIDGITSGECRSIFLDWVLTLPDEIKPDQALRCLLSRHQDSAPTHPMTIVLRDGLSGTAVPRRRGGWRSRPRG
ncbi:hypothetical protein [Pontibaca salina]|uniref:Uncharacterized protein n=1 Tax=Pontibaca salina TaxID=2795731 RepID=A0A934HUK7_9RHOB|nr:hypothetical protein [Pontibaca salina]MBI6629829.1 hypothetical protein [Pontibaca salina]